MDFDAIVIGSGFGGAITTCRLSESRQEVLILERGREWDKDSYPHKPEDDWIWSHSSPEKFHGWLDFRTFSDMSVAPGVIVAAGSLGSTELLLRCRDLAKTLPKIGDFLGKNWSSNGDLTPAFYLFRQLWPDRGPP